jgi:hypothetical protein
MGPSRASQAGTTMQRRTYRSSRWPGVAAAVLLAAGTPGCGSKQATGPEPEVALASSPEAQARFRVLREQWVSSPLDARPALMRALTDFVQRYPTDPRGRWARLYLAWINVQRNELDVAERWLALAEPGAAGAASDLSGVISAALVLARGEPEVAYRELLALSGRLIDTDDRLLCLDQLVLAALADHRWQEAVLHMLELSAQAARRHRERMWRTLEPRLASIPLRELEASLPRVSTHAILSPSVQPAERRAAVDWMRRSMLELLSRSAIDAQDVALAQRLVAAPQGASGDDAEKSQLLLLATRGTLQKVVSGRSLGLALELADPAQSQRSIDVAAGIALTLDLAAPARDREPIVLCTRQVEGGKMADALARLSGDGARLVVAGLDPAGARAAADFAEQSGLPVLLLHEPSASARPLPPNAFVLGADSARANDILHATLEQRFRGVLRVGSNDAPCPQGDADSAALLERASGGGRRPRLEFDADPSCARGLLMHLSGAAQPLVLGFGLDASGVAWDRPLADELWAVGAGRLPLFEAPRDELESLWMSRKGRPPSWYEGLGHDAAALAAAVLGPAPPAPIRDAERVLEAYRAVIEQLVSVRSPGLWTSDSDRFDAGRRLPRELRAVRLTAAEDGTR